MADTFQRFTLISKGGGREKKCIYDNDRHRLKQCIPTACNINKKGGARRHRSVYLPAILLQPRITFSALPQPGSIEPVAALAELYFASEGKEGCLLSGRRALSVCAFLSASLPPCLSHSRSLSLALSRSLSLSRLCGL